MKRRGKVLINVEDIIGKRLGKLEVIGYAGYYYSNTQGGERMRHYYVCKCECGTTKLIQRCPLKNNLYRGCGCGRRERNGH